MKAPAPAPLSQGDLPSTTAHSLFLTAGFAARAGHPLPNGSLPVVAPGLGTVQVPVQEWESYCQLCTGEMEGRAA